MSKTVLIIGGSSGLGLEIATLLPDEYNVIITGRTDPNVLYLEFCPLDIDSESPSTKLDMLIDDLPRVDLIIYAAGFFQGGKISDLNDVAIQRMINVGITAPSMLLQRILQRQTDLPGFIAITSTSQWIPRELEPVYTATKAGLGMLANSLSKDGRVGKVLVVAPSGMSTNFWAEDGRDTSKMLHPRWVAAKVLEAWEIEFTYKFIRILRDPARVEIAEKR